MRARCLKAALRPGLGRGLVALGLMGALPSGCGPHEGQRQQPVTAYRARGEGLAEDQLGRALLAEMISLDGLPQQASQLRAQIEAEEADDYLARFAAGLYDSLHGALPTAPGHYLGALRGAADEGDRLARLVSWFSASQLVSLQGHVHGFWDQHEAELEALIREPSGIGWRARSRLVQWWLDEQALRNQRPIDPSKQRLGCLTAVRLAGPFGSGAPIEITKAFAPEQPGPWPQRWAVDPATGIAPQQLETEPRGCEVSSLQERAAGVFYAESFFTLEQPTDVLLAVQGALAVRVDDFLVLDRDPRQFGVWSRFGVAVRLAAGRHRIVARVTEPRTLVRLMHLDGRPLAVPSDLDSSRSYHLGEPVPLPDPNDIQAFVSAQGMRGNPDDLERFLAAHLAHREGDADVAVVLTQPLTSERARAAGPALSSAADWAADDPVWPRDAASDRVRELHNAAVARDPKLWRSRLALALSPGGGEDLGATVRPLRQLLEEFPHVPAVGLALSNVYGKLGWEAEQRRLALSLLEQFPYDLGVLATGLPVLKDLGRWQQVDAVAQRIYELDPGTQLPLERAMEVRDYQAALRWISELQARRPDQRSSLERKRRAVRVQAGEPGALKEFLWQQVQNQPESGKAWLAWADFQLANGTQTALRDALAQATEAGAEAGYVEQAIDAVEAQTDFAPYRIDGLQVVRDYEAAGEHQPGTAARVLDYAAVWVHADGSSRMLEHEIIRLQSEEAIRKLAEHRPLPGLVLNMRVIKRDGRTLEPEQVEGKPTLTMPHLEIGDYIETESVQGAPARNHGQTYEGLRWFFREESVAYARSELLLISPTSRSLDIEVTGDVPTPKVTTDGLFTIRHYRVDHSPAAPTEPSSPPVSEFLPSVRVSWGLGMDYRLRALSEQIASVTPVDPRLRDRAEEIVRQAGAQGGLEEARALYFWVQDNVEKGASEDGRQAVFGRQGNRWSAFRELARALAIPVETVLVKNRLSPPAEGPQSEAEAYNVPLLVVQRSDAEPVWLTLAETHAPFGYVPVQARGMPGFVLKHDQPQPIEVPKEGGQDRLEYELSVQLNAEGDAEVEVVQRFLGRYAMRMRAGLEQVPEGRLAELVEARMLGQALPGARLVHHDWVARDNVQEPLVLRMRAEMSGFARRRGTQLLIELPLMPHLGRLTSLSERQTPLLLSEAMHQNVRVRLHLKPGWQIAGLQSGSAGYLGHRAVAEDRLVNEGVLLAREVSLEAGRISPEEYAEFASFTQRAESLLTQPLVIETEPMGVAARPAEGSP